MTFLHPRRSFGELAELEWVPEETTPVPICIGYSSAQFLFDDGLLSIDLVLVC